MHRFAASKSGWLGVGLVALWAVGCGADTSSPLLWQIDHDNYLLGTIHLGVAAREDLPTVVWDRLAAARRVGAEAEIRQIDAAEYEQLAQLPVGSEGLDKLLGSESWGKLVALLGSGVSWSKLSRLRPWAVSSIVYHELNPDPTIEGMDKTLLDAGDSAQKPLFFLEQWQDQVNALNAQPLDKDVAGLRWLIDSGAQVSARLRELVAAYRAGDIDEVWRLAPEAGAVASPEDPSFDTFIRQRTLAWLPELEKQLATGGAFIAVGFGHVLGADGLVARLTASGHRVRRVE